MTSRVVIIVLNWNGLVDTLACLESLEALDYQNIELIVVDNGSTDGSVAAIRGQCPQAMVIETGKNLGYTGGNNIGIEWAMAQVADYILLLNNDTEVAPDFLSLLVEVAEADPSVGMVGPLIYYHDRPQVIWSAGGAVDWERGSTRMLGLDEADHDQFGLAPRPVDFITGCALLIKSSVVEQIGPLDDRFFVYYEDAEWGARATRAGFKNLIVPQAKVWHKITPVQQAVSPLVYYYMTRNRLLFLRAIGAGFAVWWRTLFSGYMRTFLSWSVQPRWRNKRPLRGVMLRAIKDGLCEAFGKQPRLTAIDRCSPMSIGEK
jgi:GT2 family glycosyltransferase